MERMNRRILLITGTLIFSVVSAFAHVDEEVEKLKKELRLNKKTKH